MSVIHPVYTSADFMTAKDNMWIVVLDSTVITVREAMQRGQDSRQVRIQNPPTAIYIPLVRTYFNDHSNFTGFNFQFERKEGEGLLISWTVDE